MTSYVHLIVQRYLIALASFIITQITIVLFADVCFISSIRFLQPDYIFFEGRKLLIYTSLSPFITYHIAKV